MQTFPVAGALDPAILDTRFLPQGTELERGATPPSYRSSEVRSGAESGRPAPDSVGSGVQAH
ncbi:lymphocyte antigen 6 complex, locus G5C, isoform CRA_c [Homo sapiens]|nr:lymphocyte antigen 6 complex, locus G5C, isoform CRA_c [Homo sapiens]